MINYILANNLEFREYVQAYTNASFLVDERFADTEDLDGLFSGYDPHTASYDRQPGHTKASRRRRATAVARKIRAHRTSMEPAARSSKAGPGR